MKLGLRAGSQQQSLTAPQHEVLTGAAAGAQHEVLAGAAVGAQHEVLAGAGAQHEVSQVSQLLERRRPWRFLVGQQSVTVPQQSLTAPQSPPQLPPHADPVATGAACDDNTIPGSPAPAAVDSSRKMTFTG